VAVPPEQWFARASDASPRWLGLPALAGAPRVPRSVGLRHSPAQLQRRAGCSDLCSRHQHESPGHCACFVIRVTQLCRIGQVCHQMARNAELAALATTHTPSYLRLISTAWVQGPLGHAAWMCLGQLASQQLNRPMCTPDPNCSCLKLFVCCCMLSGVVLSAEAGRGAVDRYD
jgi:hypothetical protein